MFCSYGLELLLRLAILCPLDPPAAESAMYFKKEIESFVVYLYIAAGYSCNIACINYSLYSGVTLVTPW